MESRIVFWTAVFAVAGGACAAAGDAMAPGRIEAYATWHAVGLEIAYAGDDNANGSASFVWRKAGEDRWRNGVELTRDTQRRLWWGSIFPLAPGERIEVQAAFEDPDGADPKSLETRTATKQAGPPAAGGGNLWVSPSGDDGAAGTREAPLKTIARAARGLKPGDTVHVMPGVYAECLELGGETAGTPDRPIAFVGEGTPPPALDSSLAIEKGADWTEGGAGIFWKAFKERVLFVTQDGRRMFGYTSLKDLDSDPFKSSRAFFHDSKEGRLHVRTGTGQPPKSHEYRIAARPHGFHLKGASNVVVRNFEIRHTADAAVRIGGGGDGNRIIGNTILNCHTGIVVNDGSCDDTAVWENSIRLEGQTDFTWRAVMGEHWEFSCIGINLWTGRGTSIVKNRIEGYRYLITLEPAPGEQQRAATEGIASNRDIDIVFNELLNASDDGLEADFGGVNLRVYGNRMRNCNSGISVAPCVRGPVYVVRNDFTFRTLMFKFGINRGTSHGACFCDHNSGYGLTNNSNPGIYFNAGLPTTGKRFRNNILVLSGEDFATAQRPGNVLDGNCYWRVGGQTLIKFQWEGKWLHGLAALQAASGMEKSGILADPLLTNAPGMAACDANDYNLTTPRAAGLVRQWSESDFRLRDGSSCIDRGVPIRGINEDFTGKAPDIGAWERDRGLPPAGPARNP